MVCVASDRLQYAVNRDDPAFTCIRRSLIRIVPSSAFKGVYVPYVLCPHDV